MEPRKGLGGGGGGRVEMVNPSVLDWKPPPSYYLTTRLPDILCPLHTTCDREEVYGCEFLQAGHNLGKRNQRQGERGKPECTAAVLRCNGSHAGCVGISCFYGELKLLIGGGIAGYWRGFGTMRGGCVQARLSSLSLRSPPGFPRLPEQSYGVQVRVRAE